MSISGYWGKQWDRPSAPRVKESEIGVKVESPVLSGKRSLEDELRRAEVERLRRDEELQRPRGLR
jgi:hypothetical protein